MTLKQFVVIIIPPLLTFVFFLVRQPRTKKQMLYQKAQANGWYVEAKAIKWHYSTKTTNDMSDYSKIFVTYEYTINGHKQKKGCGWGFIVFFIWGILVLLNMLNI